MRTINVDVDLAEFEDADILEEAKERGFSVSIPADVLKKMPDWRRNRLEKSGFDIPAVAGQPLIEDVQEAIDAIKRGDAREALWILEKAVAPKFRTPDDCLVRYKQIIGAKAVEEREAARG